MHSTERPCVWLVDVHFLPLFLSLPSEQRNDCEQRWIHTHTHTQKRRHWTFCVHKMRMEIKILQMILLNIWRGILYGRKRVKFFHCLMPWFTLYDTLMTIWLFHFGLCSTFLLSSSLLWFLSVNMRALF